MEELQAIVQRMLDAGEPEGNIKLVIEQYNANNEGKTNDVAEPGVAVASEATALDVSASNLEDTSLDVPFDDVKDKHNWLTYNVTDPLTGKITQQKDYSFFDKSDSDAIDDLSIKYPGFKFETTNIFKDDIKSFNAVKILAPNEKEIDIEFNIGAEYTAPDTRTKMALEKRESAGLASLNSTEKSLVAKHDNINSRKENAYNSLISFIDKNTTTETDALYSKSRAERSISSKKFLADNAPDSTQLKEINDKFFPKDEFGNDIDIFAPKTETRKVFQGGGMDVKFSTPTREIIKTTQPYEKELKQAFDALGGVQANPSKEEIEIKAKEVLVAEAKKETWIKNTDQKLEELDDFEFISSDLKKQLKNNIELGLSEYQREYASKTVYAESLANKLETGALRKKLDIALQRFESEDYDYTGTEMQPGEELVTLENGRMIPESVYNQYQKDYKEYNEMYNNYMAVSNDVISNVDKGFIEALPDQLDLVKRNYNGVEEFFVDAGLGFVELAVDAGYGTSKLFGDPSVDEQGTQDFKDKIQNIRESYRKDVSFDDAFSSLENFGSFATQELANQISIFAALSTPAGWGIIGTSSFGSQYQDMVQEEKLPGAIQTSKAKKYFTSLGAAGAEVVFGAAPTYMLLRNAKRALANNVAKNDLFGKGVDSYVKNNMITTKGVLGVIAEGEGEALTTGFQNLLNGRPWSQDMNHSRFTGYMFGTTMGSVPVAKGIYLSQFSDAKQKETLRNLREEQTDLASFNKKLQNGLYSPLNDTRRKEIVQENEGRIEELQELINLEVETLEGKAQTVSARAKREFTSAIVRQEDIRIEANKILEDQVMPDALKDKKLLELKTEFDAIENGLNEFKKEKTWNSPWQIYKFRNENKAEVKRLEDQALKDLLEVDGISDPSVEQIENKTRVLFNTEQINKDIKKKNKVEKGGVRNTLVVHNTKQQSIDFVNKNLEGEALAEALEEIENGAHGFMAPGPDGKPVSVINVQNMAEADRLETKTHELQHVVFADAIGLKPELYKPLSDAVLAWTKENNRDAYNRVIKLAERNADGSLKESEVVAVFFEEVGAGNINLNAKKNTQFGGVLAHLIHKGTEEATDIDIDLASEKDAIKFLVGIANKVKNDQLTLADISDIKKNQIIQEIRSKQPGPLDTRVQFSKEASDRVQQVYEQQGEAGLFDILEAFKPITTRIARRFRDVPGYDEQLVIDEIETGKRGIFDLIREYKPESGVPLAAYINKFLPARSIEAGNRILKTEFEEDVTEARGVAAEQTVEQQPERKTKAKVLASELNIADKVASEVSDANIDPNTLTSFKSVPNAATNAVGELLGISPAKIKSKANLTTAEVANAQRWFNKNAQLVIDALPQGFDVEGQATGVPRTVLQALYTQKETRAKTAAGLKGQVKRTNIKDAEFLALVDIIDGKPTRNRNTSARIIALADLLGKTITNQELRKTDPSLARIRSGMSEVMFSKDLTENASSFTYNPIKKHGTNIPKINVQKAEKDKVYLGERDLDAIYKNGKTFLEAGSEIANKFLAKYPKHRDIIKVTMAGGVVRAGFFQTDAQFAELVKEGKNGYLKDNLTKSRVKYHKTGQLLDKINGVDIFNNKDFVKQQEKRLDIIIDFFKDLEVYLKENKNDKWFFAEFTLDTSNNMGTFARILAPYMGYTIKDGNKKNPLYNVESREEHTKPQNNVVKKGLDAAVEGKVDDFAKILKASYMQLSITLEADDNINASGMKNVMPNVFYDSIVPRILKGELDNIPMGLIAIVRLAAVGTKYAPINTGKPIDLNTIFFPTLNKTGAEVFNVNNIKDIAKANETLIESIADIKFSKELSSTNSKLSEVISNARSVNMYSKAARGMSTFDFDETLIIDGENFIIAKKGDNVQRISSGDWPLQGPKFAADGYEFDFTDFVNVRGGVDGPLLQKIKNQIKKYGNKNVFILTARPAEAAPAIHEWLKTKDIDIPFENITGLGNSSGDAKAAWMLDKYAEGYNDMYFVDDALPNVEAVKHVFDQLDIKGKSVQAKIKFSKDLNSDFNKMLQRTKGVGAEKIFSRIGAQKRGKNIGRFTFFVPPSADDFSGLLRYFVGKGEQGNKDLEFFNKALIKPFARADRDMKEARQSILDDHKALRKELPKVAKKLGKMIDDSGFTFDNAVRVYLWDKAGFDIPGLSKRDITFLSNTVKADQDLRTYADTIGKISKQKEGYIEPGEYWSVESIASDLQNVVNKQGRKKYLAEWKENVEIIFSPENLNKIEATYGSNFREALENMLWRMENGTNRAKGMGRIEGAWNNWVNNSVGAIMFFNARSAVLQTLSTVNFINFEDNNIFAAAKAFANQKQYWKDFTFLFNSDFLKQRRAGLQTNINEAEIASAVAGATNKAKAALQYLLKVGFLPTQIADSFAIASGGSTYYRNRVKKYVKQGLDQTEAEAQAMEDFMEIAEETQQSARPDRISQQQASSLGRIILAFANTPMQYARLIKKAAGDLTAGRGDWRSNVSRIIYYGAIQNIIFSSLQSAIFALAFDDEKPEQDEIDKKVQRTLNGMIDSLLRGSGLAGAVVSTLKNVINRFIQESEKKSRADYGNVLVDALNVSPPIGSKSRKLYSATKTYKYNREVMGEMSTFDLENPVWDAVGNVVSATTNLPLDRGFRKIDNMKEALNQDNETWQRVAVGLGWDQWSLGIDTRKEVDEAKKLIKEKKKEEKKKSQQRCTKIKSDGFRCKVMVKKPKKRCHYHD
mgnify:CR=1 FL=1|tara:strand:+ start:13720 stop:21891 length:8172 start_codon:yes stop_codon:yes gene_type:complete